MILSSQWMPIMERGYLPVSATQGHGLNHLLGRLEEGLRPRGEKWEWLKPHSAQGEQDEEGEGEGNTNIDCEHYHHSSQHGEVQVPDREETKPGV